MIIAPSGMVKILSFEIFYGVSSMFNVTITIDESSGVAMYEQLYRYFVGEISSGRLKYSERLPSKRALSEHLGISRSTVEAAYELLVAEGYVLPKARSGYYVADFSPFKAGERAETQAPACAALPEKREFDFSTASVDVSLFPYSSWAKLNKEVVYSSPELLQRGDRQGDIALRSALCDFLGQYRGVTCTPDEIIVGAGIEYLTGLIVRILPDTAVFGIEDPGYSATADTVRAFGRPVRYIPLDGGGMSVKSLEKSDVTAAYVTPSHQFPMGVTMPASRRSRLLKWASEGEGRYIIEDDYDSEFRYFSRPIPSLQGMDSGGRVIYMGTFSRSLAPSIRIAYLVLPKELMPRYRALYDYRLSTVSRYEQAVIAAFLSRGLYSRYLRRVGNLYRRRRAALIEALSGIEGVKISGDEGGIHFLLTNERYSEEELIKRASEAGIVFRGLSPFCHGTVPLSSTLVVGYGGLEDGKIKKAAELLSSAW